MRRTRPNPNTTLLDFANSVWRPDMPMDEFRKIIKREYPMGANGRAPMKPYRFRSLVYQVRREREKSAP